MLPFFLAVIMSTAILASAQTLCGQQNLSDDEVIQLFRKYRTCPWPERPLGVRIAEAGLFEAIAARNMNKVQLHVEEGVNLGVKLFVQRSSDKCEDTMVGFALVHDAPEIADYLLDNGAPEPEEDEYVTLLVHAMRLRAKETCRYVLTKITNPYEYEIRKQLKDMVTIINRRHSLEPSDVKMDDEDVYDIVREAQAAYCIKKHYPRGRHPDFGY